MKYPVAFMPPESNDPDSQWLVSVPGTGINTCGDSLEEALDMLHEATALWKSSDGVTIPAPQNIDLLMRNDADWEEWMFKWVELDMEPTEYVVDGSVQRELLMGLPAMGKAMAITEIDLSMGFILRFNSESVWEIETIVPYGCSEEDRACLHATFHEVSLSAVFGDFIKFLDEINTQ